MTVSILGIATAIPDNLAPPSQFDEFARKWANPSESLEKTIHVNSRTGISQRPSLHTDVSPILNRPNPAPIQDIVSTFLDLGVKLAFEASQRAITDWSQPSSSITHLICTTCTASSHPGYDLYLHQLLGLSGQCERTLIHGIGCAGGLSMVRLARQFSLAGKATGKRVRVLCVALEVTSTLIRTELDSIDEEAERGGGKPNVAVTIFSDAASAMIIGNDVGIEDGEESSFEVLECVAETVGETKGDLAFDIREEGWRAIISPRVPALTSQSVPPLFKRLISLTTTTPSTTSSLPLLSTEAATKPSTYDWFIHPGGSLIISTLSKQLLLSPASDDECHAKASWQMYKERGNASSASIGGVIERGRKLGGREAVVAVAFGPGVSVEMCLLRRTGWKGRNVAQANGGGVIQDSVDSRDNLDGYTDNKAQRESLINTDHGREVYRTKKTVKTEKKNGFSLDQGFGASRENVESCVCRSSRVNLGGSGYGCWCRS